MSDIYLQITETPTVVTLSAPVISGALSSTVTVANTVTVALDSNSLSALENVTVTVGAAITGTVTVSNFPATQPVSIASVTIGNTVTIAGTVTANPTGTQTIAGTVTANINTFPDATTLGEQIAQGFTNYGSFEVVVGGTSNISGTVTASALKLQTNNNVFNYLSGEEIQEYSSGNPVVAVYASLPNALPAGTNRIGVVTIGAGTVTIGAGTAEIGTVKPAKSQSGNAQFLSVDDGSGKLFTSTLLTAGTAQIGSVTASISNSVTIGSLPAISGTVTANPGANFSDEIAEGILAFQDTEGGFNIGSLPAISGTVTVGNTVTIAGTVTANPTGTQTIAGTVKVDGAFLASGVTVFPSLLLWNDDALDQYEEVSSVKPLPISGTVTVGSALPAGTNRIGVVTIGAGTVTIGAGTAQIGSVTASISNSVTIASLPAISGTVTANLAISSTPITKGSFTSLASATLVPANTSRKMATVYNLGAGQLFVNAGATATTLGGGFMVALSSGDFYECDYTTTTLSAIFATAGTASWVSH